MMNGIGELVIMYIILTIFFPILSSVISEQKLRGGQTEQQTDRWTGKQTDT